jgi:hypothetical protein
MLCSACASGGSGGSAIAIPGVAPVFASAAAGFASAPAAGFASGAVSAAGGAPRRPCCAREQAVIETKPKRHKKTANLKEEKNRTETMIQILPTNPIASRNPAKYFCILKRRR